MHLKMSHQLKCGQIDLTHLTALTWSTYEALILTPVVFPTELSPFSLRNTYCSVFSFNFVHGFK